jgi:hypothetical protein
LRAPRCSSSGWSTCPHWRSARRLTHCCEVRPSSTRRQGLTWPCQEIAKGLA